MVKLRRLLAGWRHRRSCDGRVVDGRCNTCRFERVDQARDRERLLDPRY